MTKRTLLVAVSGGVDSVVLLDILRRGGDRLVVAHVDHGIREESGDDARFVSELARGYGLPFVSTQLALGPDASEDKARRERYKFLVAEAAKLNADIVTAHHLDDVVGSVAINVLRGTGWRGLAVMGRKGIVRPLIGWTKSMVYDYALQKRLEWVEDWTNHSPKYLRNQLRGGIIQMPQETKRQLMQLRASQLILTHAIDQASRRIVEKHKGSRYFYTSIDTSAAIELLRTEISQAVDERPTIVQAERALSAIKTGRAGSNYELGAGIHLGLTTRTFIVARHLR